MWPTHQWHSQKALWAHRTNLRSEYRWWDKCLFTTNARDWFIDTLEWTTALLYGSLQGLCIVAGTTSYVTVTSHNKRYLMSVLERTKWDICCFVEIIKQAFQWYQTFINWRPTFEDMRKRPEKVGVYFLLCSLYLISCFALYLKISLADIRYLCCNASHMSHHL